MDKRTLNSQKFHFNVFQKDPSFAPDMEYRLSLTDTSLRPQQKNLVDLAVGDCSDILSIEELPNKAIQSDARTSLRSMTTLCVTEKHKVADRRNGLSF